MAMDALAAETGLYIGGAEGRSLGRPSVRRIPPCSNPPPPPLHITTYRNQGYLWGFTAASIPMWLVLLPGFTEGAKSACVLVIPCTAFRGWVEYSW